MSLLAGLAIFFVVLLQVAGATAVDTCVDEASGQAGVCTLLLECQSLVEQYGRDRSSKMTICDRNTRRVCCPLSASSTSKQPEDSTKRIASKISFDDVSTRSETTASSRINKKCNEYQKLKVKNETINAFILGEPSTTKLTEFCYQNKRDIGIAIEKEFPHVAIVKLIIPRIMNRQLPRDHYGSEKKCIGSLVSDRHVLTSVHCVKSDVSRNNVSVQLGAFKYDADDATQTYSVDEILTNYGLSILKLNRKVDFNQHVMPICLFPDEHISSDVLLVGWSGDWRECDLQLRKWQIRSSFVEQKEWQLIIDSTAILNYRQTLLPGCPLQIYHPNNTCQYALVGLYDEQPSSGKYHFNHLHQKLRWVENTIWPKKLVQMSHKSYRIIKQGLKVIPRQ